MSKQTIKTITSDITSNTIVAHAMRLSDLLNAELPSTRELSLAQTNLEQAMLWANLAFKNLAERIIKQGVEE